MSSDSDDQLVANLQLLQWKLDVRPAPPPLRIHHLMACAAVTAVQLSWWRNGIPLSMHIPTLAIVFTAVYETIAAVGITFAILSVYWHFKGYASLAQPGQWLLLEFAGLTILIYTMLLFVRLFGISWAGMLQGSYGLVVWAMANSWKVFLYNLIPFAIFAFGAWKIADTRPWRSVFVFIALTAVITTSWLSKLLVNYGNVSMESAVLLPILVYVSVKSCMEIWAVITDLTTRRARYWTHWTGVGLSLTTQLLVISSSILNLLGWFT